MFNNSIYYLQVKNLETIQARKFVQMAASK